MGTTFRSVTEERGKRMEFASEVTRYERPTVSTVMLIGKSFDIEAAYTFEGIKENRAGSTQNSDSTPKDFLKFFFFLFGWLMKKGDGDAQQKELGNLNRLCEAREA